MNEIIIRIKNKIDNNFDFKKNSTCKFKLTYYTKTSSYFTFNLISKSIFIFLECFLFF